MLTVALALVAGLAPITAAPALSCSEMRIEIYPPSGPGGSEVTVYYWSGQEGWEVYTRSGGVVANSTTFGGIPVSHPWGPMNQGAFSFDVPAVPPGDYEIVVRSPYAEKATAMFTVTEGPVRHNPSTIVGHTLERLNGKYERVWGFDAATQTWQVYDVSKSAQPINDLKALERGQTLWIKVTEDDVVLNWRGTLYFLNKGWNLITALGDTYGIGNVITVPSPGDNL